MSLLARISDDNMDKYGFQPDFSGELSGYTRVCAWVDMCIGRHNTDM